MRHGRLILLLAAAALTGAPAAVHAHGGTDHGERVVDGELTEVPVTADPTRTAVPRAAGSEPWRATGPRPVAVVQILLPGRDVQRYPELGEQTLREAFFTGAGSAGRALQEMTDGTVSLTGLDRPDGDVMSAVTASSTGGCRWQQWASDARARLGERGISLTPYLSSGNVAYVLRGPTGCSWGGLAWMPGSEIWLANSISRPLVVHELGHNFGLDHASSARCTDVQGATVVLSASCALDEYGDPYDPMGDGIGHYSATHKRTGGWLPAGAVRTVSASGSYALQNAADPLSATRMLRIPRPDGRDLTVELRGPFGAFDTFAAVGPAAGGVLLRLHDPSAPDARTQLLDVTTSTSSFSDAALKPGATVTDGVTGMALRLDGLDASGATVSVALEGAAALPPLGGLVGDVADAITPDPPPSTTPVGTTTPPPADDDEEPVDPVDPAIDDEQPADDGDGELGDDEPLDVALDDEDEDVATPPVVRPWRAPASLRVDGRRRSVATLSRSQTLRGRTISATFRAGVGELRVRISGCAARVTVRVGRSWKVLPRSGRISRAVRDVRVRCARPGGRVRLRALSGR